MTRLWRWVRMETAPGALGSSGTHSPSGLLTQLWASTKSVAKPLETGPSRLLCTV